MDQARCLSEGGALLREIDYWLFGARRPRSRPLRALVDGADAARALATALAHANRPGEIVPLDSSSALEAARGPCDVPYDVIACDLRHDADSDRTLATLTGLLAPGGGLRIVVASDVGGLFGLLDRAGLQATSLLPPLRYDPAPLLPDPGPCLRLDTLPNRTRAVLAEALAGSMAPHVAYARRAGDDVRRADPMGPAAVPILRDGTGVDLALRIRPDDRLPVTFGKRAVALPVPPQIRGLLPLLDGTRTVRDLAAILVTRGVPADRFDMMWRTVFATLSGLNNVLLQAAS
jgi:hypothetical protein